VDAVIKYFIARWAEEDRVRRLLHGGNIMMKLAGRSTAAMTLL